MADSAAQPSEAASEVGTQEAAWHEAILPAENGREDLVEKVLVSLDAVQQKFGSVSGYLRQRYADATEKNAFLNEIYSLSRGGEDKWMLQASPPSHRADDPSAVQCFIPVAALAFEKACSMKPDADHALSRELAERILKEGFLSNAEPLLVSVNAECMRLSDVAKLTPPWQHLGMMKPFSLGFVKGKARAHTLLAVLSICFDNRLAVREDGCLVLRGWRN